MKISTTYFSVKQYSITKMLFIVFFLSMKNTVCMDSNQNNLQYVNEKDKSTQFNCYTSIKENLLYDQLSIKTTSNGYYLDKQASSIKEPKKEIRFLLSDDKMAENLIDCDDNDTFWSLAAPESKHKRNVDFYTESNSQKHLVKKQKNADQSSFVFKKSNALTDEEFKNYIKKYNDRTFVLIPSNYFLSDPAQFTEELLRQQAKKNQHQQRNDQNEQDNANLTEEQLQKIKQEQKEKRNRYFKGTLGLVGIGTLLYGSYKYRQYPLKVVDYLKNAFSKNVKGKL